MRDVATAFLIRTDTFSHYKFNGESYDYTFKLFVETFSILKRKEHRRFNLLTIKGVCSGVFILCGKCRFFILLVQSTGSIQLFEDTKLPFAAM